MSGMHMVGPWLTTTGKKKGKKKFRNALAAQSHQRNTQSWKILCDELGVNTNASSKKSFKPYQPKELNYRGKNDPQLPSLKCTMEPCLAPRQKVYSGTLIKGISVMHKSNLVPVLNEQEIREIAGMRR